MDELVDANQQFICFCCLISLNGNKYILAPDCFNEAFYFGTKITPEKQSKRHLYSLSLIETDKTPLSVEKVDYQKGTFVKIANNPTTITSWLLRPNGTYVLEILHMSDPRKNGAAVFNLKKQLIGMYLSTNWFQTHATILPIDVVSAKPHTDLLHKAICVSTCGFVHSKNLYLEEPNDFRAFDIYAERGDKPKVPLSNGKSLAVTKQKTQIWAPQLAPEPAIEAFGIVFVVRGDRIVRVLDRSQEFPINGFCDEVQGINEHKRVTPKQFFDIVTVAADKNVVIHWSNGDEQQFKPKKNDIETFFIIWKPIAEADNAMSIDQPTQEEERTPQEEEQKPISIQIEPTSPVIAAPEEIKMDVETAPKLEPAVIVGVDQGEDQCANFDG